MTDKTPKFPITRIEGALDIGAVAAGFTPIVGGAISSVLSGMSQTRKLNRVAGMLNELAGDLEEFRSEVSDEYVKTEDFEELLEQILRRAAEERNEEVRALYRKFLFRAITAPGDDYDDQLDVLRALEGIRAPHLAVLRALAETPSPEGHRKLMGSPMQTLRGRTGLSDGEITDAVATLNSIRATKLSNLSMMMTGQGSEALQSSLTAFGRKMLEYIDDVDQSRRRTR